MCYVNVTHLLKLSTWIFELFLYHVGVRTDIGFIITTIMESNGYLGYALKSFAYLNNM